MRHDHDCALHNSQKAEEGFVNRSIRQHPICLPGRSVSAPQSTLLARFQPQSGDANGKIHPYLPLDA